MSVTLRRKRGEKGEVVETIEDVIVRRLTAERIEELKRFIKETQEKHRQVLNEEKPAIKSKRWLSQQEMSFFQGAKEGS